MTLTLDDSGNAAARRVDITPYESSGPWGLVTGLTGSSLLFRAYQNWHVEILGGTGDNQFVISGNPLAAQVTLDGGAGNDVLVGSGGNVLRGRTGRDLLIAGVLASILEGGADEDILLGGTLLDQSQAVVDAIMAEWTRVVPYGTRAANLGAGPLHPEGIVGNGGGNTLAGNEALDLYFASLELDAYLPEAGEITIGI